MANPIKFRDQGTEMAYALISLGGIRPLVQDSVAVANGSEDTYEVTDTRARRLLVFHNGSGNTDIRFELNGTASGDELPILPATYFILQVEEGDILHLYNTTGSPITVFVVEII